MGFFKGGMKALVANRNAKGASPPSGTGGLFGGAKALAAAKGASPPSGAIGGAFGNFGGLVARGAPAVPGTPALAGRRIRAKAPPKKTAPVRPSIRATPVVANVARPRSKRPQGSRSVLQRRMRHRAERGLKNKKMK